MSHNMVFKLNNTDMINIYYKLGLINIIKNLKKNNKCYKLNTSIDDASKKKSYKYLKLV